MASETGSKRKFIIPIIVVALLIAAGWGFKIFSYSRSHESTDDAQVDGHIVPVLAKVGGYVTSVAVDENEHVAEGQTVVTHRRRGVSREGRAGRGGSRRGARRRRGTRRYDGPGRGAGRRPQPASAARSTRRSTAARANATSAQADLARMQRSRGQADRVATAARCSAGSGRRGAGAARRGGASGAAGGAQIANAQAGVRLAEARSGSAQAMRDNARAAVELHQDHVRPRAGSCRASRSKSASSCRRVSRS